MDPFLTDAAGIFEIAASAASSEASGDLAILIGRDGAIRMLDAQGWRLDRLLTEQDGRAAYRVHRDRNGVRVEGCSGPHSCVFETRTPAAPATFFTKKLLTSADMYRRA